jgi:MFS family permease
MGNLGDGLGRVAVGLFAVALTRDPFAVAVVTALSYLPGLVLNVRVGGLVDRYDRRQLAVLAGGVRATAVLVLTVVAATGQASLWLLYTVVVLLYSCEAFYDNAVSSMVPMVVSEPDDLERANGRLQGARLVAESFLGPPLAGMVFALAAAFAFGFTTACYVLAALLLLRLPGSYRPRKTSEQLPHNAPSVGREMLEGLRYVRDHSLHRTLLALMITVYFGTAMVNATNVLWTLDVLGVSEALFGLFTLTLAAGALAGSQTAAALVRLVGRGRASWITIGSSGVGGVTAAATTSPYVAGVGLIIVGWASMAFGIVNLSLRQRLTPSAVLGRVNGIYWAAILGVMVVGALAGGALASIGGLRMPWLIFGTGMLLISLLAARRLTNDVIDEAIGSADLAKRAEGMCM